ncbi:MAG: DNA methyltransferase, partial [Ignavibacteriota bacterium]
MPLSQHEIRKRAIEFSREWADETSEDAEAKSFWDAFFNVFGIARRRVAGFEVPVKKGDSSQGWIDLLWKGIVLVEHKSRGRNLDKAFTQAKEYFPGLKENELPKYILVSDFARFRLYDLDEGTTEEFELGALEKNIGLFGFISGYTKRIYKAEDAVNIAAAEKMGALHDALKESGYAGHDLEVLLVRLLFCLFADDTGIFDKDQFHFLVDKQTKEDGSDTGTMLAQLFQILDKPADKRQKNLSDDLAALPYVNGNLFKDTIDIPTFDSTMRNILLDCSAFDWSKVSPAIFGSMFQSVMNPKERRSLGAHYTGEKNILKVVHGLFLDDLWEEFEKIKTNRNALEKFHAKLASMRFFDPACGCGNFLIITYREMRLLEIEVFKRLLKGQIATNIGDFSIINVDSYYGIELEEFPARIAEVAMYIMDHIMNQIHSVELGDYLRRLPLTKAPNIVNGNALRLDWDTVVPKKDDSLFILGNPPFGGKHYQSHSQREDQALVMHNIKSGSDLDFVACWFVKAAEFVKGTKISFAFVATNSITQGEQVPLIWGILFRSALKIKFAH